MVRVRVVALAAVCVAMVGCGGGGGGSTSAGTPTPDMNAVRQQYLAAAAIGNSAGATFSNALQQDQGDLPSLQSATRDFRTAVYNADKALRAIDFPDSARTDVNALLQADSDEIAALDKAASAPDMSSFNTDLDTAQQADTAGSAAAKKVRADLGLPPASSSPEATATPTPSALQDLCGFSGGAVKIIDASHDRDALLADAPVGSAIVNGYPSQWASTAYSFAGAAVSADASGTVSGCGFVIDKAHNDEGYLSFAVQDSNGNCAGGDLVAAGSGDTVTSATPVTVPAGQPCTGNSVAAAAGH